MDLVIDANILFAILKNKLIKNSFVYIIQCCHILL